MSIRELKKEARRNDIVHTAFYRFANEGFHSVQMIDISRDLGIGHGTLYRYFEDKDALYHSVVNSEIQLFDENFSGESLHERTSSAHHLWSRSAPLFDACPKSKRSSIEKHFLNIEKQMRAHTPLPSIWRASVFDAALNKRTTLTELQQFFKRDESKRPVATARGWK